MESDTISDDLVDTKTFDLSGLELDKVYRETFLFRKTSEVDLEMIVRTCSAPTDMRYSMDLCEEENDFRQKRKNVVFQAMKKLLGERGPKTLDEVPSIAVLGSGGGFRAMVSLSGVFCALKDMGVLDCAMYTSGLSGSACEFLARASLLTKTINNMRNSGDLRGELNGVIASNEIEPSGEHEDSDEEEDLDAPDAPDGKEPTEEPAVNHDDHSFLTEIMESFMEKVSFLKTREGRAGLVHNFLRGLKLMAAPVPSETEDVTDAADQLALKAKRIYLVDSGLVFNSPYPLLLRPQRDVDIFLSFDFSARDKEDVLNFKVN
ncbi:Cytosolic phospholipase A2 [Desmophyllum pertusum]|uniref:Cytosolic phospholipase A2 n=1 Tax=Desmophyllum pertusum TaxID=174260 RepID=A0A9W9ZIP3_9CNID|nr:Cytosolic phospholipase A2 [Desmophyllum pertusum]